MISELLSKGIRLTTDAEGALPSEPSDELLQKIIALEKPLVSKEDILSLVEKKIEVKRPSSFKPVAKEYDSTLVIDHKLDVTGKSRTKGGVDNFVSYFKNRYERISKMLRRPGTETLDICDVPRHINEKARMLSGVRSTSVGDPA